MRKCLHQRLLNLLTGAWRENGVRKFSANMKHFLMGWLGLCLGLVGTELRAQDVSFTQPGMVKREFVAAEPPTKSSHASTIIESKDVLIASWFGGEYERSPDVSIFMSRNEGKGWSEAVEVANGIHEEDHARFPTWNPVLFRGKDGPLYLFYKEGPSPSEWWGLVKTSSDNGRTWSKSKRLPMGMVGPVRNKPIELADGTILCGSSTEDEGWRLHMERTRNPLGLWTKTPALNGSLDVAAIQPTLLNWPEAPLQLLCRSKNGAIYQSFSDDTGFTWRRVVRTELPNPNSAIDAVLLRDGRALLVYNHSTEGRSVMNVAVSKDGKKWEAALLLENSPQDEFSYPAVIQGGDRMVHITYTWRREKIRHVVIDPSKLATRPIIDGQWPW